MKLVDIQWLWFSGVLGNRVLTTSSDMNREPFDPSTEEDGAIIAMFKAHPIERNGGSAWPLLDEGKETT